MEAYAALPLPQLPFLSPKLNRNKLAFPSSPSKQRSSQSTRLHCQKMYVPGFGEASPEAKGAKNLHNFFNYIAVRIVTAQLQGRDTLRAVSSANSYFSEQSYNPEAYNELMEFLERHSLNDGDKFCADLMRESSRHKDLALRILEVRSAYCKHDFEWDNLKRLVVKMADESNTRLMRDYVLETSYVESEK